MAFDAFKKLVRGLTRTREGIASSLQTASSRRTSSTRRALDELETSLLAADLGPALTEEVVDEVRRQAARGGARRRGAARGDAAARCARRSADPARGAGRAPRRASCSSSASTAGGKTTTIGKLAARERAAGRNGHRRRPPTRSARRRSISSSAGPSAPASRSCGTARASDPSAVVFDALTAARARGVDTVLVDTAGRLHTKAPLMAELEKMARIAGREIAGAPHEVLLVIDATTGQNGVAQAREFTKAAAITGRRPDEARRHREGGRRARDPARARRPDPLRRRRRGPRRPPRFRSRTRTSTGSWAARAAA